MMDDDLSSHWISPITMRAAKIWYLYTVRESGTNTIPIPFYSIVSLPDEEDFNTHSPPLSAPILFLRFFSIVHGYN